eukprot:10845116-Prorocentrum_lima.AAC.1
MGRQVGQIGKSADLQMRQVGRFERLANVGNGRIRRSDRQAGRSDRQIGRLADPRGWQVREIR